MLRAPRCTASTTASLGTITADATRPRRLAWYLLVLGSEAAAAASEPVTALGGDEGAPTAMAAFTGGTSEKRAGEVIEYGPTDDIFNRPKDGRTEDYITGRFG